MASEQVRSNVPASDIQVAIRHLHAGNFDMLTIFPISTTRWARRPGIVVDRLGSNVTVCPITRSARPERVLICPSPAAHEGGSLHCDPGILIYNPSYVLLNSSMTLNDELDPPVSNASNWILPMFSSSGHVHSLDSYETAQLQTYFCRSRCRTHQSPPAPPFSSLRNMRRPYVGPSGSGWGSGWGSPKQRPLGSSGSLKQRPLGSSVGSTKQRTVGPSAGNLCERRRTTMTLAEGIEESLESQALASYDDDDFDAADDKRRLSPSVAECLILQESLDYEDNF